jgi:hypothetical protein
MLFMARKLPDLQPRGPREGIARVVRWGFVSLSRRDLLFGSVHGAVAYALLGVAWQSRAVARPAPPHVLAWAEGVRERARALRAGELSLVRWQDEMAVHLVTLPLEELVAALDLEAVKRRLRYPADRAATRAVALPGPRRRGGGRPVHGRLFGLAKGRAIVPHAHNNMVSAHLVLDGEVRARTFDRTADVEGALLLAPVRDEVRRAGSVVTMSDARENAHWFLAVSERAHTFDIPLTDLVPGKAYPTKAGYKSMIFLDPLRGAKEGAGLRVPVVQPRKGIELYGASGL